MNSYIFTAILAGIWGFNLLNTSGIGAVYHTTDISRMAAVVLSLVLLGRQVLREKGLFAQKRYFYTGLAMAFVFMVSCYMGGQGLAVLDYIWAYLIVYIFSQVEVRAKALRLAGFCYAGLGAAILYIYGYMDALDGWNGNTIAMIGLFSFLIFMVPYFGVTDRRSKILLPLVGAVYVVLLIPTDSRSCMIAIGAALLLTLRIVPSRRLLRSRGALLLVLLVPLIVAAAVALVSGAGFVEGLNNWSMETFGKPVFNARDAIWLSGFQLWGENLLIGTGKIAQANWHNSAVDCLVAFGTIGFILWVRLFHVMLCEGRRYSGDVCVAGAMTAFIIVYCQQAVELGLMSRGPNMLPYVMLGLLLGRVRYLKRRERLE